jgi:glutaryl-CoA dehydrogenase
MTTVFTQAQRMTTELTRALGTDYYLLEDLLTDEERDVRDRVRAFVDAEVLPVINRYWERAEFPFELIPRLARLGIIGTTIQGYGCPGLSRLATGLVTREMSRGDGSVNTFIGVHSGLAMGAIHLLGSAEQKQRWLPAMARLDKVGAFALTEPKHGSDSVALETTARRDGRAWVLNGDKRWIGNASFADVVIVWARDVEDGKVKAFVVEKNADGIYPEGYSAEVITGKIGKRAVWQADMVLRRSRLGVAGPRHRGLRDRAGVRAAAGAVRQADRHFPAGPEQAGEHARGDHLDAAVLLPHGPAPGAGTDDRPDGVAGEDEPRAEGPPDLPGRA